MKAHTTKLYTWATNKAESSRSPFWITLLFVLEIGLFLPLDAVLMFFCLQNRKKILLYIVLATLASTVSGLIGYLLGHFLWDLIGPYVVPHLISATAFSNVAGHFQQYESWAVFIGALIPFPVKILALAAGVFNIGLVPFLTYFLLARIVRFCLIGGSVMLWGDAIKRFLDRHFHRVILLLGAKIAVAFTFFWTLAQ